MRTTCHILVIASLSSIFIGCGDDANDRPPQSDAGLPSDELVLPDVDAGPGEPLFNHFVGDAVRTIVHAENAWWIGGRFRSVHAYSAPHLLATDLTGAVRTSCDLQAGFEGTVNVVAAAGNALFVGGTFSTYRGVRASSLVKIDATTCERDETFSPPTELGGLGPDSYVNALAVSGTSLYVGGTFNVYRGVTNAANSIAKLDLTTGALDTTFSPPGVNANGVLNSSGTPGEVLAIVLNGNALYLGGTFNAYRGALNAANHLAKLDATTGVLDTTFSPAGANANGFDTSVIALAFKNNALYAGGRFTRYRNVAGSANRLAKLDATTGVLDTTFSPNGATANGVDEQVDALTASDTALYVGGSFTAYRGVASSAQSLAKLDLTSGALDTTFSPAGTNNNGFDARVRSLSLGGSVLMVGGDFDHYRDTSSGRGLAKLDATTGAIDLQFHPADRPGKGVNQAVRSVLVDGNNVWAGGFFSTYSGFPVDRIAKLDDVTLEVDTTFSPPELNGFDGEVRAIAVANGKVYVGGNFTKYRGGADSARGLAKLDATTGAIDTTFSPPGANANGVSGAVLALTTSATSVYAGGVFVDYRGVANAANYIAKLDLTTGVLDTTFSPAGANGFNNEVHALVFDNNSLYVGGDFNAYRGVAQAANYIAKLDGTSGALDTTFSPSGGSDANGFNNGVSALCIVDNGLYAGGYFERYRGTAGTAEYIARLDKTTGTLDTTFSPPAATGFDDEVRSLAAANGALFVGGQFSSYRGVPFSANSFAKLDLATGTLDAAFSPPGRLANGFDSPIDTLAVRNGVVYAGGYISTYRGEGNVNGLARIDATTGALRISP